MTKDGRRRTEDEGRKTSGGRSPHLIIGTESKERALKYKDFFLVCRQAYDCNEIPKSFVFHPSSFVTFAPQISLSPSHASSAISNSSLPPRSSAWAGMR